MDVSYVTSGRAADAMDGLDGRVVSGRQTDFPIHAGPSFFSIPFITKDKIPTE